MQPVPFLSDGNIPLMAAPSISIDLVHQSGTQGIPMNISNSLQKVTIRADKDGFITSSKKLAVALVTTVVSLGVDAVQVAHAS